MTQFTCKGVKQINNRISLNMTFTFTIRISLRFSSAQEFQMGNFQKYWSQNVGQDFLYLIFFTGGRFWKLTGGMEGTLKIGLFDTFTGKLGHGWLIKVLIIQQLSTDWQLIGDKEVFCGTRLDD
jgi:hypothetical protein